MATECVTSIVASDSDVRIKMLPKRGGQRIRVVVEYDPEVVHSVQVIESPVDQRRANPP